MMGRIDVNNFEAYLLDFFEGRLDGPSEAALREFAVLHPELNIDLTQDISEFPQLEEEKISGDFSFIKKPIAGRDEDRVLEYLEKQMSAPEERAFEKELATNNELLNLLHRYRLTALQPEPVLFEGRAGLHQSGLAAAEQELVLSYLEGQMSAPDEQAFGRLVQSSVALQSEIAAYKKTFLLAEQEVKFPVPADLKKEGRILALFSWRSVSFAAAAAVLLLAGFWFVAPSAISTTEPSTAQHARVTVPLAPELKQRAMAEATGSNSVAVKKSAHPVNRAFTPSDKQSVAVTKQTDLPETNASAPQPEALQQLSDPNALASQATGTMLVESSAGTEPTSHYGSIAELETSEDLPEFDMSHKKENFWQKAVSLTKRANRLGLVAVKAEEDEKNHVRLSFNSFSVEKK